jgi:hypothetical protein
VEDEGPLPTEPEAPPSAAPAEPIVTPTFEAPPLETPTPAPPLASR